MAVTATLFGQVGLHLGDADIDWVADTIKCSLHTATFSPAQDTMDFQDDLTNEITGTGYTADGAALTSKSATYDSGTNENRFDAADISWTSASFTAAFAVFYKERGGADSANEIIGWINFDGNQTVTSGTFTIQLASSGVFKLTVS